MRTILIIGALALLVSACGSSDQQNGDDLAIVATTTIIGDVVANVVGDDGNVTVLTPVGVDPHDYRPSARQVAEINNADLVVSNGFGLEEGLSDVLETAADDGVTILELAPVVMPIPGAEEENDPHFWLDPIRMAEGVRAVGSTLADLDDSVDWAARAEGYAQLLMDTHQEIELVLHEVPPGDRKLVTNHDSFGYFADQYGYEIVGVVIPGGSTLGNPSSGELADLVAVIEAEAVPAIFAETTEGSALATAVASEVGAPVEVVELYTGSLGEPGSGAETYIGMLRVNAERISKALGQV